MKGKKKPIDIGTVVETKKIGNTTIHICSDHFPKNDEEKREVLRQFHEVGWRIARRLHEENKGNIN